MKNIKDFFENKKFYRTKSLKDFVISAIKQETNIVVKNDFISFSGSTIFLSLNPKHKSIILENKKAILDSFSEDKEMAFFTDIN